MESTREMNELRLLERQTASRLADHGSSMFLTAVFLIVCVCAAAYGFVVLLGATKEILVAVVGVSGSLLAAMVGYAVQRAKDIELADARKQHEIALTVRAAKQANYARILDKLAPYIRKPTESGDEFAVAYLHTWIAGSVAVVQATHAFIQKPTDKALDEVVRAMRDDLTTEEWGSSKALDGLSSSILFGPVAPPPALGSLASDKLIAR